MSQTPLQPTPQKYLGRKEAAEYLRRFGCKITHRTLANWRAMRKGPPVALDGNRRAVYKQEDLDTWWVERLKQVEF